MVKATSGGGDFYRPPNGVYVATLLEAPDGGPREKFSDKTKTEETWLFRYSLASYPSMEPFINDDTKEQAVVDPRLTQSLHINSNARKHLRALLRREIQDGEESDGEDGLIAAAVGESVLLEYGDKEGRSGVLLNIMPAPAPAAAAN